VVEDAMSELNGDKARFQKNRKRKLKNRQRIRALLARLAAKPVEDASGATITRAASLAMQDEGGPTRAED
jgi:hypothetical protein